MKLLILLLLCLLPLSIQAQAIDQNIDQSNIATTICTPGWTKKVRPSSAWAAKTKLTLLRAKGLTWADRGDYELDHIVPLALGGAPRRLDNLQVQPWEGPTGAKAKDVIETRIHRAVCAGKLTLNQGRACFLAGTHPTCAHSALVE
jgi:hypothetical protein